MSAHIAETILAQLGGRRFIAMTGAKNFNHDSRALVFSLPRITGMKINRVRIQLEADDTYTVIFMRWLPRSFDIENHGTAQGVYADNLRRVFEQKTGLLTSLGAAA